MKSVAMFCVLATMCYFGTDGDFNAEIESMTSSITKNIKDLDVYSKMLTSDLRTKLRSQKFTQITNFNDYINIIISDIESAIAAARKNGKNADRCLEPSRTILLKMIIQSNEELSACIHIGLSTIMNVTSIIDKNVLLCNNILQKLERMQIDCRSLGASANRKCLMEKIPSVSEKVQSLTNIIIKNLKNFGDTHSVTALTKAMVCNEDLMEKKRDAAEKYHENALNCIASI